MLNDTQMRVLAADFMRDGLIQTESWRFESQVPPDVSEWLSASPDWLTGFICEIRECLATGQFSLVFPLLDDLIAEADELSVPKGSDTYHRFARHLTIALLHFLQIELERQRGNYTNPFDTARFHIVQGKTVGAMAGSDAVKPALPITRVIEAYTQEKTAAGRWEPKTIQQNQASLNLMMEILGDQPITNVTHHDMLKLRETIRRLPGNKSKSRVYRGKTIDAILRMKGIKPMSTVTCNNILTRIASFWNWAHRHEYVDRTPAHDLLVPTSKRADEERAVYTKEELQLLVDAVAKFGKAEARPERIWVPLIAMFSGMRPNEIAQLHTDDIVEADAVPCFRVADTHPGQKVKNRNARRFVPIHPFLLEYGFREYLAFVRGNTTGRVFPRLRKHRDGYFAYLGRWFQKINREHVTKDKQKVFYSLRHNFITTLKDAQAPMTAIAEIVGHAVAGETAGRYGKRYQAAFLLEVLKQVNYGLDMSDIKDAASRTFGE